MNLPEVRRKGGRGSLRGGNGGVAHVWAGQKLSRFFFQRLRPPFIGTTRALSFLKILYFLTLQQGRKRLRFQARRFSTGNEGSPGWRIFNRNSSSSISPTPRTFSRSAGSRLCRSPFLIGLFHDLKLGRRVLREREEERLLRQARRPLSGATPRTFSRSARPRFCRSTFLLVLSRP